MRFAFLIVLLLLSCFEVLRVLSIIRCFTFSSCFLDVSSLISRRVNGENGSKKLHVKMYNHECSIILTYKAFWLIFGFILLDRIVL